MGQALQHIKNLSLLLFFLLCQVMGPMCGAPEVSSAAKDTVLAEGSMACTMHESFMCLPSLTSSPDRHAKCSGSLYLEQMPASCAIPSAQDRDSVAPPRAWSSVLSIVPVSIASSSVLRI